jgi:hypothetical protein
VRLATSCRIRARVLQMSRPCHAALIGVSTSPRPLSSVPPCPPRSVPSAARPLPCDSCPLPPTYDPLGPRPRFRAYLCSLPRPSARNSLPSTPDCSPRTALPRAFYRSSLPGLALARKTASLDLPWTDPSAAVTTEPGTEAPPRPPL